LEKHSERIVIPLLICRGEVKQVVEMLFYELYSSLILLKRWIKPVLDIYRVCCNEYDIIFIEDYNYNKRTYVSRIAKYILM